MLETVCQNLSFLLVLRTPSRISWIRSGAIRILFNDYKAELTRIRNRSFINNFDYIHFV